MLWMNISNDVHIYPVKLLEASAGKHTSLVQTTHMFMLEWVIRMLMRKETLRPYMGRAHVCLWVCAYQHHSAAIQHLIIDAFKNSMHTYLRTEMINERAIGSTRNGKRRVDAKCKMRHEKKKNICTEHDTMSWKHTTFEQHRGKKCK